MPLSKHQGRNDQQNMKVLNVSQLKGSSPHLLGGVLFMTPTDYRKIHQKPDTFWS